MAAPVRIQQVFRVGVVVVVVGGSTCEYTASLMAAADDSGDVWAHRGGFDRLNVQREPNYSRFFVNSGFCEEQEVISSHGAFYTNDTAAGLDANPEFTHGCGRLRDVL